MTFEERELRELLHSYYKLDALVDKEIVNYKEYKGE